MMPHIMHLVTSLYCRLMIQYVLAESVYKLTYHVLATTVDFLGPFFVLLVAQSTAHPYDRAHTLYEWHRIA